MLFLEVKRKFELHQNLFSGVSVFYMFFKEKIPTFVYCSKKGTEQVVQLGRKNLRTLIKLVKEQHVMLG